MQSYTQKRQLSAALHGASPPGRSSPATTPADFRHPVTGASNLPIVARLENWGQWCRVWRPRYATASLEGHYRAPRGAEVEWETVAPPQNRAKIDPQDALAVERASALLPLFSHALARSWYVYRWSAEKSLKVAAKLAGLPRPAARRWDDCLETAHRLFGIALETPACVRRDRLRVRVRWELEVLDTEKD